MSNATARLAKSGQIQATSAPIESAGLDIGNGALKLVLSGSEVKTPSYYLPVHGTIYDAPDRKDGGLVEYVEGDRPQLRGKSWFTGGAAYQADPNGYSRVVDDLKGKTELGLQLFLGAVSTLYYQPERTFNLVASIHHESALGEELIQALEGTHVVKFNGSWQSCAITINVLKTLEEGAGAVASQGLNLCQQSIVYDIGNGTIIASVFGSKGRLMEREVLPDSGVEALIDRIARNAETIRQLGREGDREIIRAGIENQSRVYARTGWSFADIYAAELKIWLPTQLKRALKWGSRWTPTAERIIAIGGGAQLPYVAPLLEQQGITPIADGAWANARGLHRLAVLLGR